MDDLRALRAVAAPGPAQVAEERAVGEQMRPLADQRGAPAVVAGDAIGGLRTDALAQQLTLEIGLGDAKKRPQHGTFVRRRPPASCRRPLVARPLTLVFSSGISGTATTVPIRSSGGQRPDKQAKFRYRAD